MAPLVPMQSNCDDKINTVAVAWCERSFSDEISNKCGFNFLFLFLCSGYKSYCKQIYQNAKFSHPKSNVS